MDFIICVYYSLYLVKCVQSSFLDNTRTVVVRFPLVTFFHIHVLLLLVIVLLDVIVLEVIPILDVVNVLELLQGELLLHGAPPGDWPHDGSR